MSYDYTLADAKAWLREQFRSGRGVPCPCCDQFVKEYRRKLPAATTRVLIALYRHNEGRDFIFLPDLLDTMTGTPHQGGYGTLGQFWGLMERRQGERDDGSKRVGWWRLTDLGRAFVRGEATVPVYAYIYNGKLRRYAGDPVDVRTSLGHRFNYDELMSA